MSTASESTASKTPSSETASLQTLTEQQFLQHKAFYNKGYTRSLDFRLGQLTALKKAIQRYESEIFQALKQDLGKSNFEAYATEVGFVLEEIGFIHKHLSQWIKPESVKTPLVHQPAQSEVIYEPRGVTLIIAPWNYPFQLLIDPLIGAIAAGNCALLKPSELTPHTSAVMARLIQETFDSAYISVMEGGIDVNQDLLDQPFDLIFFTGSTRVGKIVMEKAAKHLTPVILELGGKSPCIVDRGVPLDLTARRIVWGKFLNAGQTCVAPDYVLVPREDLDALCEAMAHEITRFYGADPLLSPDYGRIVSADRVRHLQELLAHEGAEQIVCGGHTDVAQRYFAPTLVKHVDPEAPLMQEEIFGPILPILPYDHLDDVMDFVQERPRPLALYLFSENEAHQEMLTQYLDFGGGCINDAMIHLATPHLPFGGKGSSGMGAYHGKYSFEAFSHRKALLKRPLKLDMPLRYPPYPAWKEKVVRQVMK